MKLPSPSFYLLSFTLHLTAIGLIWLLPPVKSTDFSTIHTDMVFDTEMGMDQPMPKPAVSPTVPPKIDKPTPVHKLDKIKSASKPTLSKQTQVRASQSKPKHQPHPNTAGNQLRNRISAAGYNAILRQKIKAKWNAPMMNRDYQISFFCLILIDGRIDQLILKESSGFNLLDQAAKQAILTSAPFPPPPSEVLNGKASYEAWFRFHPETNP